MAKRSVQLSKKNSKKRKKNKQDDAPPPPAIPVTILSGFLGSGKTTLMRHILTSMDHGLKIAVIVNDMAELNIDGQIIIKSTTTSSVTTTATKPKVVTLQNGCICCNLRGDLIREIHRIQQLGQFDYVLIESTGIAEPQQVAESFCVDPQTMELAIAVASTAGVDDDDADANSDNVTGQMLLNAARLDTCVTVVDALHFPKYLSSLNRFKDLFQDGLDQEESPEEGEKSISQLMMEQVEFANVIVLNKIDMVSSEKELNTSRAIIKKLNPTAKIITATYGKIDVKEILNTSLFDLAQASESPGWLESLKQHGVSGAPGEADEYGVSSFVYRNDRPFHPKRLHQFLSQFFCFADQWNNAAAASSSQSIHNNKTKTEKERNELDEKYGRILRSKGNCWLAGRDSRIYDWAQTGQIIALQAGQPWFCLLPREEWGDSSLSNEDIEAIEDSVYNNSRRQDESSLGNNKMERRDFGDRKSVVVLIGTDMKQDSLTRALNDCCLTQEELLEHHCHTNSVYGTYEDPLHPPEVAVLDGVTSCFMVARHGQDQHFHVSRGCSFTIQNLSLLAQQHHNDNYKVRVWLDQSDDCKRRGVLLATLRPDSYEQHSMSLTILPRDVVGGEVDSNRRIRIEVVLFKKNNYSSKEDYYDLMELCEVHIAGKVEPLPFAEDLDEQEAMTDEDSEDSGPPWPYEKERR